MYELPAPPGGNPAALGVHDSIQALNGGQDTTDVQVRVTNKTEFVSCASGFNIGGMNGALAIYDVRVEAQVPPLQV